MTTIVQRQTAKPTPKPTLKPTPNALAAGPLAMVPSILRRVVARVAAGLSRQAINRRVVRKLAVLSDRELKDIGLVRQDVEDAGSAIGDASLLLLARRDERRRGRAS